MPALKHSTNASARAGRRLRPTESRAPEPILTARGVAKTYRTGTHEVTALRGVDLDVRPGELVMVMGPSGNGRQAHYLPLFALWAAAVVAVLPPLFALD